MVFWMKLGGIALAAGLLAWLVDDYAWQRSEVGRQREALAIAVAANETLATAAAEAERHHAAVVSALAAAADAERAARAELADRLEELGGVDPSENCTYGPGLRALLDGLR